jgi:flavin-dependent dehydrogenase
MKPVTIIGGGLAGLTLGIALRREGVPVTVWEVGHYPRHRVCGEFISGRGQDVLMRLGLKEKLLAAEAREATSAQFWLGDTPLARQDLPRSALCLSRHVLDELLAAEFKKHGGDLRENARWQGESSDAGLIMANGRRRQPTENGWRWLGLKIHAHNFDMAADLEMHSYMTGYIGICRLSGGVVNVCGLFRLPEDRPGSAGRALDLLTGPPDSALRKRMDKASLDEESFCSVAGISLRRRHRDHGPDCRIGDALTLIPPVTGNGMSIAFESAQIAIEPVTAYSRGEIEWGTTREAIHASCESAFGSRLAWAGALQWAMFSPLGRSRWIWNWLNTPAVWRLVFTHTR